MNKTSFHPRFSLNGVAFHGDIASFCTAVEKTFPPKSEERANAKTVNEWIAAWASRSKTMSCRTSGSTGTPCPIALEKTRMAASARMTARHFDLQEGTRALLCLPVSYIAGGMMLARAMVCGWELWAVTPSSHFLGESKGDFDFAAVTPLQLRDSIGELSRVRKILVGGGSIPDVLLDGLSVLSLPRTTIYQSYAMTETMTHVAVRQIFPHPEKAYAAMEGIRFSLSCQSTLVIKAPCLNEYPIATNDVVTLIDDRHFIWKGRRDGMINSGGIKIFPEETEKILSKILGGRYFAAGIPDDRLGERQVLFIEGEKTDYPHLDDFIRERFDAYHAPKETVFLPVFPLTHTGKTDRKKIVREFLLRP